MPASQFFAGVAISLQQPVFQAPGREIKIPYSMQHVLPGFFWGLEPYRP